MVTAIDLNWKDVYDELQVGVPFARKVPSQFLAISRHC